MRKLALSQPELPPDYCLGLCGQQPESCIRRAINDVAKPRVVSGTGKRSSSGELHVAVDVLVEEIAEPAGPTGIAGLRTEGAKPHEIAGLDLDPILVQAIDRLALQNIKA